MINDVAIRDFLATGEVKYFFRLQDNVRLAQALREVRECLAEVEDLL